MDDSCPDEIFDGAMPDLRDPALPHLIQDGYTSERTMQASALPTPHRRRRRARPPAACCLALVLALARERGGALTAPPAARQSGIDRLTVA